MSINLLAWREQKQQQRQKNSQWIILWLSATLCMGALVSHYYLRHSNKKMQQQNQQLQQAIRQLHYTPTIKKHYQILKNREQVVAMQKVFRHQQENLLKTFIFLGKNMPDTLRATQIELNQKQLHLNGNTAASQEATHYAKALSQTAYFSQVSLQKIEKNNGINTFQLKADLNHATQ